MFFHYLIIVIQKILVNFETLPFFMYSCSSIFGHFQWKYWCPPDICILVCLFPCFVHQKCIKPHRNEWPCTTQCLFRLWSKPMVLMDSKEEIIRWQQRFCGSFEHSLHPDKSHELFISAMALYWMSLAWFWQNAIMCCNWITEAASHPRRKVKVSRLCHLHGNCMV